MDKNYSFSITNTQSVLVVPRSIIKPGVKGSFRLLNMDESQCTVELVLGDKGHFGSKGTGSEENTHHRFTLTPDNLLGWDGHSTIGRTRAKVIAMEDGGNRLIIQTCERLKKPKQHLPKEAKATEPTTFDSDMRKAIAKVNCIQSRSPGRYQLQVENNQLMALVLNPL